MPSNEITIRSSAAEYLTYIAATGDNPQSIEMRYEDENIWLTQKLMAVLYDVDVRTINYHIKKILEDGELNESSVIRKYWITAGSLYLKKDERNWNNVVTPTSSYTQATAKYFHRFASLSCKS